MSVPGHCPNLVTNQEDRKHEAFANVTTFQVTANWEQTTKRFTDIYDSLADMWSQWYRQYLDADYPRILVRLEDMLFRPDKTMKAINECVGITIPHEYQYYLYKSKIHGDSADFVQALGKYGKEKGRYESLTADDLEYAKTALDPDLMRLFQYTHAPDSYVPPKAVYEEPFVILNGQHGEYKMRIRQPLNKRQRLSQNSTIRD